MEINFAETMKALRRQRGITQEELAGHLDISVQAVSKWERGDSMPDIMLLPAIASYYDTTVDFLLGCDDVRRQKEIEQFKQEAQVLINQGKRAERLALCREMQKKYPNDETVLNNLMHDLFAVNCVENSREILSLAERLLNSANIEIHYGAVQMLTLTYSRLGDDEAAVKYAKMIPPHKDLLQLVLKGEELAEHCRWVFWKACDELYLTESCLTLCPEAGYSAADRHQIRRTIYQMFHLVFSDGDFGFWEDRLARLCRDMAICSSELGLIDRALDELEEMCVHLERLAEFSAIDHTSPMVRGLHYEAAQVGRSSQQSLAGSFLRHLNENERFGCLAGQERLEEIKRRLAEME